MKCLKALTKYNNNHVFLIAKRCIDLCMNKKHKPGIDCFKRMLFTLYEKEKYIANRKGKLLSDIDNGIVYYHFKFLFSLLYMYFIDAFQAFGMFFKCINNYAKDLLYPHMEYFW